MKPAKDYLGAQIWLERDDTPEHINALFAEAAAAGLGYARIFLMWPWIEPKAGEWDPRQVSRSSDSGVH